MSLHVFLQQQFVYFCIYWTFFFLNSGRANRHLFIWERLKGLTPPPLYVHCPNADTRWLDVHIMDHATEQAWHYCRVPTVLIHSPSQIWLAAKGSDNNIFSGIFMSRHGVPILVSSLKMACMRIVSHSGQDFFFSCKRLAGVMLVVMFRKDEFCFLCTCCVFSFK